MADPIIIRCRASPEKDDAEQDGPEQAGIAKGRDEGDFTDPHRHDDRLVAGKEEDRGASQATELAAGDRLPAPEGGHQQEACHGDRGCREECHGQRRDRWIDPAGDEVAPGGRDDAQDNVEGSQCEPFRSRLDDDENTKEADAMAVHRRQPTGSL